MLAALFIAAVSQTPFAQVGEWFIYNEEKSCVMYLDIAGKPLFRFSKRDDVDRLFVNVVSKEWSDLRPFVGRPVFYSFQFPNKSVVSNASLAEVIDNGDGSFGFGGGSNLEMDAMLEGIADSYSMIVDVNDTKAPHLKGTLEAFPIFITYSHGAAAVALLKECSIKR